MIVCICVLPATYTDTTSSKEACSCFMCHCMHLCAAMTLCIKLEVSKEACSCIEQHFSVRVSCVIVCICVLQ